MHFFITILKQRAIFFLLTSIFVISCITFFLFHSKIENFIYLHNFSRSSFLTSFFSIVTFLGNGYFLIICCLIFIFSESTFQLGLRLIFGYILSGLFVQMLKKLIHLPRPKEYIDSIQYSIDLVEAHSGFNSFPSGHTTSAFAFATVLCLSLKNKKIQFPIFLIALLIGFSRVYLGHHFLEDVVGGCVVGTLTGIFTVYIFQQNTKQIIYRRPLKPQKIQ